MNWSAYRGSSVMCSALLAMEGLAAFFLESTFLGLWIFGWNVLPRRVHLATIWLVAIGAMLSAAFIMAANSGCRTRWDTPPTNQPDGRASSIGDVMTNPVFIWAYIHVVLASALTGAVVMLAVSAWHLRRRSDSHLFRANRHTVDRRPVAHVDPHPGGSHLGVIEATYQPMKIAAAEPSGTPANPARSRRSRSAAATTTRPPDEDHPDSTPAVGVGDRQWNGEVQGMNELQAQYEQEYGPGYYIPNVFIQYWSMRVMAYLGALMSLLALWGAWLLWRRKLETSRVFLWVATWAVIAPFLMNTAGWMLTENGRQPWLVQGLMKTEDGVSPSVSTTDMVISLAAYYAIFIALAGVYAFLMFRYARRGWSWSTRSRRTTRVRQR